MVAVRPLRGGGSMIGDVYNVRLSIVHAEQYAGVSPGQVATSAGTRTRPLLLRARRRLGSVQPGRGPDRPRDARDPPRPRRPRGPVGWDLGFLGFGALLLLVGLMLSRSGQRATP